MDNGNAPKKPINILIVDDHPAVRQGLSLLLGPERITVCAEAGSRAEALSSLEEHRPDVVLIDLSLGDENGLDLTTVLRERNLPFMVYSMHEDGPRVERAFAAGALGYVTKREVHRVLVQAVREVASGRRFVSPRAAIALAEHAADGAANAALGELSSQEQQVYRLLGQGETAKEIAAVMDISTRTVESYSVRICTKLGLDGMRELRRHAISHFQNRTP